MKKKTRYNVIIWQLIWILMKLLNISIIVNLNCTNALTIVIKKFKLKISIIIFKIVLLHYINVCNACQYFKNNNYRIIIVLIRWKKIKLLLKINYSSYKLNMDKLMKDSSLNVLRNTLWLPWHKSQNITMELYVINVELNLLNKI